MKCFRITFEWTLGYFRKAPKGKDPSRMTYLIYLIYLKRLIVRLLFLSLGSVSQMHGFLCSDYKFLVCFSPALSYSYHKWYLNSLKWKQNHLITTSHEVKGTLFRDHYTYSSNRKSNPAVAIRDISVIRFLSKCLKYNFCLLIKITFITS